MACTFQRSSHFGNNRFAECVVDVKLRAQLCSVHCTGVAVVLTNAFCPRIRSDRAQVTLEVSKFVCLRGGLQICAQQCQWARLCMCSRHSNPHSRSSDRVCWRVQECKQMCSVASAAQQTLQTLVAPVCPPARLGSCEQDQARWQPPHKRQVLRTSRPRSPRTGQAGRDAV